MNVKVKLFATLLNYGPEIQVMDVPENSTLEYVIRKMMFPEKMPFLKVVNGEHRDITYQLKEGDEIAFFPPIAGGGSQ